MEAFLGKLLVMAGSTVDVITLGQEALCADWLLAFKACEAFLMPHLVLVLHVLGSWNKKEIRFNGPLTYIFFPFSSPCSVSTLKLYEDFVHSQFIHFSKFKLTIFYIFWELCFSKLCLKIQFCGYGKSSSGKACWRLLVDFEWYKWSTIMVMTFI